MGDTRYVYRTRKVIDLVFGRYTDKDEVMTKIKEFLGEHGDNIVTSGNNSDGYPHIRLMVFTDSDVNAEIAHYPDCPMELIVKFNNKNLTVDLATCNKNLVIDLTTCRNIDVAVSTWREPKDDTTVPEVRYEREAILKYNTKEQAHYYGTQIHNFLAGHEDYINNECVLNIDHVDEKGNPYITIWLSSDSTVNMSLVYNAKSPAALRIEVDGEVLTMDLHDAKEFRIDSLDYTVG